MQDNSYENTSNHKLCAVPKFFSYIEKRQPPATLNRAADTLSYFEAQVEMDYFNFVITFQPRTDCGKKAMEKRASVLKKILYEDDFAYQNFEATKIPPPRQRAHTHDETIHKSEDNVEVTSRRTVSY